MTSERWEAGRVQHVGPDLLESLAGELNVWRKTPFDRLVARSFRPPALTAAVADVRGVDPTRIRTEDIRTMLVEVVAAVEPAQAAPFVGSPEGAILSSAVVREVFGLTVESKNASTRQRQELAGQRVGRGISADTIRKHNQVYVEQLAAWIREHRAPQSNPPTSPDVLQAVSRPEEFAWLHAAYRQLLASKGGLFLLWGLDGIGKTTLARQFADQIAPAGAIGFIRIGRRGLYEDDVRWVLRREGLEADTLPDEQCIALFRRTATRFRTIRLLVLDDARNVNDITALLPRGSNVPVLVTAPEYLRLVNQPGNARLPARQPAPVSVDDATAYLTDRFPAMDDKIVRLLAELLGGHVETLHHVVHYLGTKPAMNAEALVEDIALRTRYALSDLAEIRGAPYSLPVILQQQLRAELRTDPVACAILTSIIWTNSSGEQPRDLITEIVGCVLHSLTELELQAAVLRLERLGLFVSTEESFVVTRLTTQILRDLLANTREAVLVAYEQVIAVPPDSDDHRTLLQILRHEYEFLRELRQDLAETIGNTLLPLPTLLALDDSNWALFMTDDTGRRRVEMYRTTPESLLWMKSESLRWEKLGDDQANLIEEYALRVYPTIEAGWLGKGCRQRPF